MNVVTEFLGWCTVINMGLLIFATLFLLMFRGTVSSIHGKMFGLPESDLIQTYFNYLAYYKISIFIFNLVPYLALKIMA